MQTTHLKPNPPAKTFPHCIQIQATTWEDEPRLIALFDDGQLMLGYFNTAGSLVWHDLPKPSPKLN